MLQTTKKSLKYKIPLLTGAVALCTAGIGFQAAMATTPTDATVTPAAASCPRLQEDPNWVPQGNGLQDGSGPHGHGSGQHDGTGPHGSGSGLRDGSGQARGAGGHGSGLQDGTGSKGSGLQDGTGPHGSGRAVGNGGGYFCSHR